MEFIDVLFIVISLSCLMYGAYKGASVILIAPVIAIITAFVATGANPLYSLTEDFMPALVTFIKNYFPLFLAGSIFGKLMGDSGAAKVVANTISSRIGHSKALMIVVIVTAILTYGGVSLFVAVFAVYPIAVELFRKADLPKRLIAPAIALGGFTFTMTAMPGSPQTINAIPTKYLGTNIYAAPVLGLIASIIIIVVGALYLNRCIKRAKERGEGYGNHNDNIVLQEDAKLPNVFASFTPMLVVFFANQLFTWLLQQPNVVTYFQNHYPPSVDEALRVVNPIWPVTASIIVASLVAIALFFKFIPSINKTLTDGTIGSLLPIFNTASENGYGGVIKLMPGFTALKTLLVGLPILPLFQMVLATTVLAAIVGSSSAGTALALETFGEEFLFLMETYNIPAPVVHRIVLLAAGSLDTLPHCGAVITLFTVTHLTHKESYKDLAFITMIGPVVAIFAVIGFYYMTGIY